MNSNSSLIKEICKDKKWFTISNVLTSCRILLTPFIVYGISVERWSFVFVLFLFVAITDLLDGYFARLFKQDTNLGRFLDPLADKLLLISSFSALAFLQSPSFYIPSWFVFFILFREATIVLGTYIIMKTGIKLEIAPTISGKLTTFFQLLFILWLFICHFFSWAPAKTYYTLLTLLTVFSLLSLFQYLKIGFSYLSSFFKKN